MKVICSLPLFSDRSFSDKEAVRSGGYGTGLVSPPPCYALDLFSVALSSTPWPHFAISQLVCLLPVGIFKHFVYLQFVLLTLSLFRGVVNKCYYYYNYYYYYYYFY